MGNHMPYGTHSVSCYPAVVTFSPLLQPTLVLDLATPEGCKAELMWVVVTSQQSLPTRDRALQSLDHWASKLAMTIDRMTWLTVNCMLCCRPAVQFVWTVWRTWSSFVVMAPVRCVATACMSAQSAASQLKNAYFSIEHVQEVLCIML